MYDMYGAFVPYPCSLIHSGGKEVGVEEHFLAGYFFKAGTSVPEEYCHAEIYTDGRFHEGSFRIGYMFLVMKSTAV